VALTPSPVVKPHEYLLRGVSRLTNPDGQRDADTVSTPPAVPTMTAPEPEPAKPRRAPRTRRKTT